MRVAVYEIRWIEVRKKAREHMESCRSKGLCLACGQPILPSDKTQRDVHMRCYHATYRAVRAGKTTWEERQKEGKIGEASQPGRKASNPVSVEVG